MLGCRLRLLQILLNAFCRYSSVSVFVCTWVYVCVCVCQSMSKGGFCVFMCVSRDFCLCTFTSSLWGRNHFTLAELVYPRVHSKSWLYFWFHIVDNYFYRGIVFTLNVQTISCFYSNIQAERKLYCCAGKHRGYGWHAEAQKKHNRNAFYYAHLFTTFSSDSNIEHFSLGWWPWSFKLSGSNTPNVLVRQTKMAEQKGFISRDSSSCLCKASLKI